MTPASITTKDGLLYRNGKLLILPEANELARQSGYQSADQMVRSLESGAIQPAAANKTSMPLPPDVDERRGCTSASNAQADALCAGRHQAQRGIAPASESDPDADYGRAIHEALKTGNTSGLDLQQKEQFDRCQQIERQVIAQFFGDTNVEMVREQRYWVKVKNQWEHSGQPDVTYKSGHRGLVIEYKMLTGDIPASPHNLQLRDQVSLFAGTVRLKECGAVVIQPLVTMQPELCLYGEADIKRAQDEMFLRVEASNALNPVRTGGDLQCKFCRAKRSCVQYQQWIAPKAPATTAFVNTPVNAWTPEQRTAFCDAMGPIVKWLDECKDAMKAILIVDPDGIPGWTLKDGTVRETITDPQVCADRFIGAGGDLQSFMTCITVGKTKLKSALATVTGQKGKALDKTLSGITEGITTTSQAEPSLVKRKA